MRKTGWLVLAAAVLSASAAVGEWTVRPWGGFSTVAMKSGNDAIFESVEMLKSFGFTDVTSVSLNRGYLAGLEVGCGVAPGLAVVLRGAYLGMNQASVTGHWPAQRVDMEFTYRGWAIPVVVGLRRTFPLTEGVEGVFGVFAGMGFAGATIRQTAAGLAALGGKDYDYEMKAAGAGFASEGTLGVVWHPSESVSLAIDLGLRVLRTPLEFTTDVADQNGDGKPEAVKGMRMRNPGDTWDIEADAGGLFAVLSTGVSF